MDSLIYVEYFIEALHYIYFVPMQKHIFCKVVQFATKKSQLSHYLENTNRIHAQVLPPQYISDSVLCASFSSTYSILESSFIESLVQVKVSGFLTFHIEVVVAVYLRSDSLFCYQSLVPENHPQQIVIVWFLCVEVLFSFCLRILVAYGFVLVLLFYFCSFVFHLISE